MNNPEAPCSAVVSSAPERYEDETRGPDSTAPASTRVLVVDDEPLMRLFVVRALKGAGYEAVEAESAERALELLERESSRVSLLLSDVQLPGIGGSELVEQARSLVPGLPTLLMSGSGKHWLVNERLIEREADLLQKPFRIADLLTKLEQLLAGARRISQHA